MSKTSDLHALLTDLGRPPESPDGPAWDAPDARGVRPSDLMLLDDFELIEDIGDTPDIEDIEDIRDIDATIPFHLPTARPVVRDDRARGRHEPPDLGPAGMYAECDFVLYSCPDCGRDHFVTVDPCPPEAEAAAEVAMVNRR